MSKSGSYLIYGRYAVLAALENQTRRCHRLYLAGTADEAVGRAISQKKVTIEACNHGQLAARLPREAVSQGLALEVEPLGERFLDEFRPAEGKKNLIVVLDQVTDPHNVGAIFRSAAAFGARAIITQDRHSPPEGGALAKAASGALDIVPWVRVKNLSRALEEVFEMGYWRLGLDSDADKTITEAGLGDNIALMLGAEGKGLRPLTAEHCDLLAKIPISGEMESLNVSNAAAVALYELCK